MRVLLAFDGSTASKDALKYVGLLLCREHELMIVHVAPDLRRVHHFMERVMAPEGFDSIRVELEEKASGLLSEAAALARELHPYVTTKLLFGYPIEQICRYARQEHADLVVLGTRGLGRVNRLFLGSTSDGVLRHGECSVLLVPDSAKRGPHIPNSSLRLMLGYDASPACRRAVDFVMNNPFEDIQSLSLVTVLPKSYTYGLAITMQELDPAGKIKKESEEALIHLAAEFKRAQPSWEITHELVADSSDIRSSLEQYASQYNFDLVVVGSKGQGTFERIVLGSVASHLAHGAIRPLMVVR